MCVTASSYLHILATFKQEMSYYSSDSSSICSDMIEFPETPDFDPQHGDDMATIPDVWTIHFFILSRVLNNV